MKRVLLTCILLLPCFAYAVTYPWNLEKHGKITPVHCEMLSMKDYDSDLTNQCINADEYVRVFTHSSVLVDGLTITDYTYVNVHKIYQIFVLVFAIGIFMALILEKPRKSILKALRTQIRF